VHGVRDEEFTENTGFSTRRWDEAAGCYHVVACAPQR
jgi:hypothetical protein